MTTSNLISRTPSQRSHSADPLVSTIAQTSVDPSRFELRRATTEDAETIAYIAALVNINNYSHFDRGFLLFSFSQQEYADKIEHGYHVYLFVLDGEPIGFTSAVRRNLIQTDHSGRDVYPSLYPAVEKKARELGLDDYVVVHQVAIIPNEQNKGYGEIFISRLNRVESGPYFSVMLESPLRNPRIRYWSNRGVEKIEEIRERPSSLFLAMESGESPVDELVWGLYYVDERGWRPRRVDSEQA
ncbi:MAG: hypothetical protein IT290_06560 [Deltaproteobacteria bacterium]|nr:hypothetical protein [Deltaproteobacteria bacterium]